MVVIFDLDGTLANCEHRRHFVDPKYDLRYLLQGYDSSGMIEEAGAYCDILTGKRFKPDWPAFYQACDKDEPIEPTIMILEHLIRDTYGYPIPEIQIWSGRCESVRDKTKNWIENNIGYRVAQLTLKMRPTGDNTPDDVLKERWLDEYLASMWPKLPAANEDGKVFHRKDAISFVFDDRPKVVRMWRRRGIFVFDCNQTGREF